MIIIYIHSTCFSHWKKHTNTHIYIYTYIHRYIQRRGGVWVQLARWTTKYHRESTLMFFVVSKGQHFGIGASKLTVSHLMSRWWPSDDRGFTWSNHMRESLPDSVMIVWQGVGHCLSQGWASPQMLTDRTTPMGHMVYIGKYGKYWEIWEILEIYNGKRNT